MIYTTDHGVPLPGAKCTLTDAGCGVSLILRGPKVPVGVCDALNSQIDVFPSLCDYLQIEPPQHLQGRSFWPVLRGEQDEINDEIFMEITHHAAYEPMRGVRTARWKYVRRFDGRGRVVLPNVDDSSSKDVWVEADWRERAVDEEELFDLGFDPNEARDLAGNAAFVDELNQMRQRLENWMKRTNDPILDGPVPVPPGTMEKDPDDLSPSRVGR